MLTAELDDPGDAKNPQAAAQSGCDLEALIERLRAEYAEIGHTLDDRTLLRMAKRRLEEKENRTR